MPAPLFVHLRNHSAFSLSEGALQVKLLAKLAKEAKMPALAITDSNNLFGALEFSEALSEKGIQPIIGLDLKVDCAAEAKDQNRFQQDAGIRRFPSLVLLAKDEQGYLNLMKLSSSAFLDVADNAEPHVSFANLAAHSAGLICLTGGSTGPVSQALTNGQRGKAEEILAKLKSAFGTNLYVELQRHGMEAERASEAALIELAYENDLPLVATNECYFATPDDYAAHDALICIAEGEVLSEQNRRHMTPEHYFKSQQDMAALFADVPEAVENTIEIARRCAFWVKGRKPILPRYAEGDEADMLRREAMDGLNMRLATTGLAPGFTREDYDKRLDFELSVIIKMQYPGYFLIVADFIKWAKAQSIPVGPGRGSGAGSLVAYSLTITDLDPLRFGLLFERFLNPDRVSMPDFDVDFCQDRRDEVITYVQQRYGADRVAQIITFGKLQSRMVTRDVGRVLQLPYGQVNRLSQMIPNNPANPISLQQAIDMEPRLAEEQEREPNVKALFDIALKLEGLYRNASTHAAGIVIGDRPLTELVPLYRDPRSSLPATQFNMKYVEKAGLVKFDFLGLKTLTVIDKAQKLIRKRIPDFDAGKIPLDDAATFAMLAQGETVGVFQLESAGMKDAVRAMRADRLEDLIALVALYRPGPMANIPTYCARKLGKEKVEYLHPVLEPILKETFGVITYQEQVQQAARDMAGYTLAQADLLRRAMGKKIKSEMDAQRENFMKGALANNIPEDIAKATFDACAKFAEYGFNKSHSAPYAYISYQTAYLKSNHPAEFLAASMTLDLGNTDKLMLFRREAQRLGIKVLPPSVNAGGVDFAVKDGAILYSMAALKNVGAGAVAEIVKTRDEGGPFKSLSDFSRRVDAKALNRRALESLVKAGAFDVLNPNRAQVLEGTDTIIGVANRTASEAAAGEIDMFGALASAQDDIVLPRRDAWLPMERLGHEFDAVGFYLSGHPLDEYAKPLARIGAESIAVFREKVLKGATAGKLAGTITYRQERRSKSGNKFAFVGFSDPTGQYETIVFSDTLVNLRDQLEPGRAVVIRVEAEVNGEEVRMSLQGMEPLDKAAAAVVQGIKIFVRDASAVDSIAKRLQPGGKAPATLTLMTESGREIEISLGSRFAITPQVKGAIKAIHGVVDVHDL
ncbi:DNA polymerase III subunit alpha [Aestuariivirga litoralis]|uniref:DNA polymerase III subunit alpha n=1 Tax=Aestuariivirga litoralis TaxID=2650924 RepID=UPI0018C4E7A3|nr:DNA polymerase III subunit alpha [Aestuariivirga litoralis]MBG1231862.1 DNA polymerase III subunit alpha [Aestuariivirga litoralis]